MTEKKREEKGRNENEMKKKKNDENMDEGEWQAWVVRRKRWERKEEKTKEKKKSGEQRKKKIKNKTEANTTKSLQLTSLWANEIEIKFRAQHPFFEFFLDFSFSKPTTRNNFSY
jgi:hypothetical protein